MDSPPRIGRIAVGPFSNWAALAVAAAGIGVCATALLGFVLTIFHNNLFWYPGLSAQEHYTAVGESYSQGFLVGFFLCFFLILVALIVANVVERRRAAAVLRVGVARQRNLA